MKKFAIPLLFLAITNSFAQHAKEPVAHWQEYTFPKNNFAISAPSSPDVHPDPLAPEVTVYYWQFSGSTKAAIHAGIRHECMQLVNTFKESVHAGIKKPGMPDSAKEISLDGNPGIESTGKNRNGEQYHERIYCVGENAYAISGIWVSSNEPAVLTRWLNTFRLLSENHPRK